MSEENRIATFKWLSHNLGDYKLNPFVPISEKGVNKTELLNYYQVDESLLSSLSNNRLVRRGLCVGVSSWYPNNTVLIKINSSTMSLSLYNVSNANITNKSYSIHDSQGNIKSTWYSDQLLSNTTVTNAGDVTSNYTFRSNGMKLIPNLSFNSAMNSLSVKPYLFEYILAGSKFIEKLAVNLLDLNNPHKIDENPKIANTKGMFHHAMATDTVDNEFTKSINISWSMKRRLTPSVIESLKLLLKPETIMKDFFGNHIFNLDFSSGDFFDFISAFNRPTNRDNSIGQYTKEFLNIDNNVQCLGSERFWKDYFKASCITLTGEEVFSQTTGRFLHQSFRFNLPNNVNSVLVSICFISENFYWNHDNNYPSGRTTNTKINRTITTSNGLNETAPNMTSSGWQNGTMFCEMSPILTTSNGGRYIDVRIGNNNDKRFAVMFMFKELVYLSEIGSGLYYIPSSSLARINDNDIIPIEYSFMGIMEDGKKKYVHMDTTMKSWSEHSIPFNINECYNGNGINLKQLLLNWFDNSNPNRYHRLITNGNFIFPGNFMNPSGETMSTYKFDYEFDFTKINLDYIKSKLEIVIINGIYYLRGIGQNDIGIYSSIRILVTEKITRQEFIIALYYHG